MAIRRNIRYSAVRNKTSIKTWKNKLEKVPCFILGNSPALEDENLEILHPFFSIGINRSFYKFDTTILFWQDIELWYTERKNIIKTNSVKVCRDKADPQNRFFHFKLEPGNFELTENPGSLKGTGATGPLAVQFAYLLGCDPIIILGMDCKKRGQNTDFYGRNRHHKSHTLSNCYEGLKWIKKTMEEKGTTVINCSKDNDIFEYHPLKKVVDQIDQKHILNRAHWVSRLS